nr:putative ribonuclease H-like domain-containing protein [Tanacetum cinerariifolium]
MAYTDSDYARASLDRKSTTEGCQFLGSRLILWQCKKQTVVATSTAKSECMVVTSCSGQQTAAANTLDTRQVQVTATTDGKVKLISEASIRRHLKLEDSDGISTSPNTEIFKQLALIGVKDQQSQLSPITHPQVLQQPHNHHFHHPLGYQPDRKLSGNIDKTPSMPYDSPLPRVNILRSDEGSMPLQKLTVLCTTLSQNVKSLEVDLKQTKQVYGAAYTKLIMKVKKSEKIVKISKARRKAKLVVSDDEEEFKDPSKQGRREAHSQPEDQLKVFSAAKVLVDAAKVYTYTKRRKAVNTGSDDIRTASRIVITAKESVSIVGASMPVSTVGMIDKATMRSINDFVLMESEEDKAVPKLAKARSLKRDAEEELKHEGSKKQKTSEASSDNLVMLWSLVKERFNSIEPTNDKERVLWVELKRLFEPDTEDELWEL